jgi:hypothetical protein
MMPPLRPILRHFVFCLASLGHLTADKREIFDFPKLPLTTYFIRKMLDEIALKSNYAHGLGTEVPSL